jgi:ATP-binding cassette, subfamily B, bacterial
MREPALHNNKMVAASWRDYGRLLVHYLRPQSGTAAGMAFLLLAGIGLRLINPQIIRTFLDTAQSGGGGQALLLAAGLYIGFSILQTGLTLLADYSSKMVSWTAINRLREDLLLHLLRLDMPFHKEHTPGELIERVDGDINLLGNFFSQFTVRVVGDGLLVLGILALLFRESVTVGIGMVIYTAVTLVVLGFVQRMAGPRWAAEREAEAEMYGYLEERISGAEEIRAAAAEPYVMRRLYGLMRTFMEKIRAAFIVTSLSYNLTNLVYVIGHSAGLVLGVVLYLRGQASLGTAYLILNYVGMLSEPLQNIRAQAQDFQSASACLKRIYELLHLKSRVTDPGASAEPLPAGALSVDFRGISFRYEDNDHVLHGVSFAIQPGRVLGILGRTGSGKSTLTRLLFRLYDPDEGTISLSGVDLCKAGLSNLRSRVGMVTQDVQLFQASLKENLTLFDPAIGDEQIATVLRDLRLWDWVRSLPGGIHAPLAGSGQGISAGEAQLLAFARVFLKNPGLVILDEASSRLDPATENLMERAVDRLFSGRTGVVIAHRLQTVQRADDILILESGRVVEYGPRAALAADPGSRFAQLLRTGLEEVLA